MLGKRPNAGFVSFFIFHSSLFFAPWQRSPCLDWKVFTRRIFCVSSPSCLHEKPRKTAGFGKEMPQRCSVLKVKLSVCSALFAVLAAAQKGLEVSRGSVSRCGFVEDRSRSRKLCTILPSNLFNVIVIALHFIMSCAKPWSGSAVQCLWYSFSRTKYFIAGRWVFVLWEAIIAYG